MDQSEVSMISSENSGATRESSRMIILKSRLNSTGHSACTSEVHDIFGRQTYVPSDWWQLMCSIFSSLEPAGIQWRRPSVILHIDECVVTLIY